MLNDTQKKFLKLCESIVYEDSKLPAKIGTGMAATAIMKHIHSKMNRSHKMDVEQISKNDIEFAEIKKYGGFYILLGDLGFVVLWGNKSKGMQLAGVKKGNTNVKELNVDTVPQVRAFIKEFAGKIEKCWKSIPAPGNLTTPLKNKRQELKAVDYGVVSVDTLFDKFRPLFVKAGQVAVADVRGAAINMIKTGNYSDLASKIEHLKKLESFITFLEGSNGTFKTTGDDDYDSRYTAGNAKEFFKGRIKRAIELTALYYAHADKEFDPTVRVASNAEMENQLLSDIQNGDTKKLSTLITYFKNGLL